MQLQFRIRQAAAALIVSVSTTAWAQTVYRCGNLYSDAPCPGAKTIDASDTRTAQQKAQTDAAARQSTALADRMERERRALEQTQRAPSSPGRPQVAVATPRSSAHSVAAKPKKASAQTQKPAEPFTASVVMPAKSRPGNDPDKPAAPSAP